MRNKAKNRIKKLLTGAFFLVSITNSYANNTKKSSVIEADYNGERVEFPLLKSNYQVGIHDDLANTKQAAVPLSIPKGINKMAYAQSSNTLNYQFASSSAPEPSTLWALLILGLIGIVLFIRNFLRGVTFESKHHSSI